MAKADKSTVLRRTNEILRLILAGGEFEDIRQYAAAQGWELSERQLRRYQEAAHQKLGESVHRDRRQLLGRHLMQRRALYARALKTSDVRTALQVLRDEAILEGLYPSMRNGGDSASDPLLGPPSPLSRQERFLRILAAETSGDKKELELMEHLTPYYNYRMPDTMMARQMLNIMAMIYVSDQLDHASMLFMALWRIGVGDDEGGFWDFIAGSHAYRFKIEVDAWEQFTGAIKTDGRQLIVDNHRGTLLELFADRVYEMAPAHEAFVAKLEAEGGSADKMATSESIARQWHWMLGQVLED